MRSIFALVVAGLLMATTARAGRAHFTLRAHLEANANDGATFSVGAHSSSGRAVVLEKVPAISERDVIAFRAYPASDGSYGALFQLDDHGRLALNSLSVERRGSRLHVFANGRAVAELEIDRGISDGKLFVASGLTSADLVAMKKEWPRREREKK